MGFFSWKTADTKESIANIHSDHRRKFHTVYMLMPDGKEPLREDLYEGYGEFSGCDAYVWVGIMNGGREMLEDTSFDNLRLFGMALSLDGGVFRDKQGRYHSFHYPFNEFDISSFFGNFGTVQLPSGKTPNELIESGEWEKVSIVNAIIEKYPEYEFRYPLKFSYNSLAVYEDLPASEDCEYQGYFYPESELF